MLQKVRSGKLIRGPKAPYGFSYSPDGNALVIDEQQMAVIRLIFRVVGAEGDTLGSLIKRLHGEGVAAPAGGGNWYRTTLRYLLRNELYRPHRFEELEGQLSPDVLAGLDPERLYGLWAWNKRRTQEWRERDEDGQYRTRYKNEPRPRSEWSVVPVDLTGSGLVRDEVDAARERLSDNTRRPPSRSAHRFWQLSGGIARCAVCGSALSPITVPHPSKSYKYYTYYTCRTRYNNSSRDCTNRRNNPAWALEEGVWKALRAILSDPERVLRDYEQHIERRKAQLRGDPGKEARELLKRLQKLDKRRSGFLDLAADGDMSREELRGKVADLDEQRETLEKALREAEGRQEAIEKLQRDRELVLRRFAAMRGIDLLNLSPENRRRVMQALRLRAEVDEHGDVRLSGIFDAAITELLPMAQADPGEPYRVRFRHEIPPRFPGVVTLDISRRAG